MPRAPGLDFRQAVSLIKTVCEVAGSKDLIERARVGLDRAGVLRAIQKHDDEPIFGWLAKATAYQGVSDAAAQSFMDMHGTASAGDIRRSLEETTACEKLHSYWQFVQCGFRKADWTCNQPELIRDCPLPGLDLRNGSLVQSAFGLYFYFRDVAGGDFVAWVDRQLRGIAPADAPARLIIPLRHVHGVSDKVLNMALASLLLAGDDHRKAWKAAGAQMLAIDTLVHAWLHRTGILRGLGAEHAYGQCYGAGHCADILRQVSDRIDARRFNRTFPRRFPRFVQHAIWRFCAQQQLGQCNGNTIDDRRRCALADCILFDDCARLKLGRPTPAQAPSPEPA